MAKRAGCIAFVLLLPVLVSAQLKSTDNDRDVQKALRYGLNPIGLISESLFDPSRFHMQQSYSMSFMSLGNQSISQAMYLNTMTYQISNPLSLSLQWGIRMNKQFGDSGQPGHPNLPFNDGLFVSGAQLRFTPSKNTELKLEFRQHPNNYFYGMPFYGR